MSYISDYKSGYTSDEEYRFHAKRDNNDYPAECCGNCAYHKVVKNDTFICNNEESDYYGDYTEYSDRCEFYG